MESIEKLTWIVALIACPFAVFAMPREGGDEE